VPIACIVANQADTIWYFIIMSPVEDNRWACVFNRRHYPRGILQMQKRDKRQETRQRFCIDNPYNDQLPRLLLFRLLFLLLIRSAVGPL
jgi:hypothetical protein